MTEFRYVAEEKDEGIPVKDILRREFTFSSRLRSKLKHQDLVQLNGQSAAGWIPVSPGDVIIVRLPEEHSDFAPEDIPIDIVFEDEYMMVVNKQAGVAVHPTKGKPDHTIANGITRIMSDRGQQYKIRFVNRLDMNTSGLLIAAKDGFTQEGIIRQMRKNQVVKKYMAVVTGEIPEESGTIDLPIGRPSPDEVERWVLPEDRGGSPSVTHYRVLGRFNGYTLVELKLDTGRTHQIRVHMSYIGYPIVGDNLYCHGDPFEYRRIHGDIHEETVSPYICRQALHAWYLSFCHPVTGSRIECEAPLPEDMRQLIRTLMEL